MSNVAELTKYPTIFRNSYWGNFRYDNGIDWAIIKNRDEFVETENIKKRVDKVPQYVWKQLDLQPIDLRFDHLEVYDAGETYVIVNSPYVQPVPLPPLFELSKPLYTQTASSMIARIAKRTRRTRADGQIRVRRPQ